ncbi:STAS domain-containing protein [Sinobaca sp. H24]|uniref:STAS domain-containing protein n=1 Tax=Sinobaca sp. H24 TaxID=2923376 RepID=UPI002079FB79|nr:STAS domain-containing protein [Sinobaca sp. H24]
MNLDIKTEHSKEEAILYIEGEVDAYTAPQLKEAIEPLTEKDGQLVTVDLTDVSYIDSTGLGIFVGALKSSEANNSKLRLVGLNQRVMRLFSITGLDEVIDIEEGKKEGTQ